MYDTNAPLHLKKSRMCKYYEENQVHSYGEFDDDMLLESVYKVGRIGKDGVGLCV